MTCATAVRRPPDPRETLPCHPSRWQTVAMPLSDEERRVIDEIERQFSLDAARERDDVARAGRQSLVLPVLLVVLSILLLAVGFAVHPLLAVAGAALLFGSCVRIAGRVTESWRAVAQVPPPQRLPTRRR